MAVVTSGPVYVPFDDRGVAYQGRIDTGDRGAYVAEQLLRRKYSVIFVYGEGSYRPFTRVMAKRIREGKPTISRQPLLVMRSSILWAL